MRSPATVAPWISTRALATTRFTVDGVTYTREVLSSAPDQVLAVHLTSEPAGHLAFDLVLDRPADATTTVVGTDTLLLSGQAQHGGTQLGTRFAARVRVRIDDEIGTVSAKDGALRVEGAGAVTLLLAASTDYNPADTARPLAGDPGDAMRHDPGRRGGEVVGRRCDPSTRPTTAPSSAAWPSTWAAARPPSAPPTSGSRRSARAPGPGARRALLPVRPLPADRLLAARGPARQPAGDLERAHRGPVERRLPRQHQPPDELLAGGGDQPRRSATSRCSTSSSAWSPRAGAPPASVYGAPGFVAHHTTDAWHWTAPFGKLVLGLWPHGGGWSTQHFMEHYRFTGDREFLETARLADPEGGGASSTSTTWPRTRRPG